MSETRFLLVVVQISNTYPHDVMVKRKTIASAATLDELYPETQSTAERMVREGYSLCNWHLFDLVPMRAGDEDTGFTIPSKGSVAKILATIGKWQESEVNQKH